MDSLSYREGSFTCSWLTLIATDVAFAVTLLTTSEANVWILICLMLGMGAVVALSGMWVSLQFKWIHMQHPAVALVFERCVITAALPAAAMMHTLGLAVLVAPGDVPYYLAAILCILYAALGTPLVSSFHNARAAAPAIGGGSPGPRKAAVRAAATTPAALVQGKSDAALMAFLTLALPAAVYASIHWVVLWRQPVHVYSLLLLGCVPALAVALMPQGLWWLPGGPRAQRLARNTIVVVALAGALVGLEGRVIFHSFRQYIKLQPPWDWVAVSLALFGTASVCVAQYLGALGSSIDVTIAGSFLLLCTTAGSLAAGVPFAWLPAPLVGACGLALFFDSRSLREYAVFVGGAFLTGVWFVVQHYWFLDIAVGGLHLRLLCKLALAALLPALMVPGLVYAHAPPMATGALLVLQASLVCVCEEALFVGSQSDGPAGSMYPGYLVLTTSALGLLAAHRLARRGHIGAAASWLLHCLYAAKAAMLLLPEAYLVVPLAVLLLAASAPRFLYLPHGPAAAASAALPARRRVVRLPPAQGVLHVVAVVGAVGLARFALFDIVQLLVSSRPGEGLLLGVLVGATAAALMPLVSTCYAHSQTATRGVAVLALSGLLLALLQPPLPLRGGAHCPKLPLALCPRLWDERHIPMREVEDVEIWGRGLARKEHWPRWLLLGAVVVGAGASAASGPSGATSTLAANLAPVAVQIGVKGARGGAVLARLVVALVTGSMVGAYVALEVVPRQVVLQGLVATACVVVVAFVALLPSRAAHGPWVLPPLALLWFVLLGLTMLLQAELPVPEPPPEVARLFPDAKFQVEQLQFLATRTALLAVYAAHALLLGFALKLRVSTALRGQDARIAGGAGDDGLDCSGFLRNAAGGWMRGADLFCGVVPSAVFQRFGRMLRLDTAGNPCGVLLARLQPEGLGWAPTLCNLAVLSALLLGVVLNGQVTGGAPEAVFMLCPLLLLLHQDPVIMPGLTAARRYVPLLAAGAAFLAGNAITTAIEQAGEGGLAGVVGGVHTPLVPGVMSLGGHTPWAVGLTEVCLVALTLPSVWELSRFLWTGKVVPGVTLLVWAPLNLLPLALTTQPATRLLALGALAANAAQWASMRHHKHQAMKVI